MYVILKCYFSYFQIDEDISLGSCTYDVDWLVNLFAQTGDCEQFLPEGQTCSTPLKPGHYAGGPAYVIELPKIPSVLVHILKPLKALKAELYGIKPNGSTISCLAATIEITA